jgi:hypothetical protein
MTAPQKQDVPVQVESPSRSFFPMVRCTYLSIECDDPLAGWNIVMNGASNPFLLLGLSGIIYAPFGAPSFESVQLLSDLFDQFEDKAGLLINFDDLWLPPFLFSREIHVGDVYRLGYDLFLWAYSFRNGRQSLERFLGTAERMRELVFFSEIETKVFVEWSEQQAALAKKLSPKDPGLQLRTRR